MGCARATIQSLKAALIPIGDQPFSIYINVIPSHVYYILAQHYRRTQVFECIISVAQAGPLVSVLGSMHGEVQHAHAQVSVY